MSTSSASAPRHRAAIHHMQSGEYRAAINVYDALLRDAADDTDLLNDAALAYALAGETRQAEQYFRRALDLRPDHEAAFFNLLDLLLEQKNDVAAGDAFEAYAAEIPETADKYRYAERLDKASALTPSGDGAPTTSSSRDTLNAAFVCGPDRKFITDIEREIGKRHEVRTAYFDDKVNLQQIQRVMDWADVTWFEWCDKILAHASQKLRKTSRVVCRLHRYEVFSSMPQKVNWSFVDQLVFVSEPMRPLMKERHAEVMKQVETTVIPNGVDLDRFPFKEREPGFNLAYVGYLHHRKNPSLLLQGLHALVEKDPRYHLHIAGYFQQPDWESYFHHMLEHLNLKEHVTMHGWVDDISTWLDDKHYLVSTSVHESFGYGIAEAMARGIKPVIHHFKGADQLFPKSLLFQTVSDFLELVTSSEYDSKSYQEHIHNYYSLEKQIKAIECALDQLTPELATLPNGHSTDASIVHLPDDIRMIAPSGDHISSSLHRGQFYENKMLEFIRSRYSSPRVVDVGAHIGNHTVYLAGPCGAEHIYSFEPNPRSFNYLRENIRLNEFENVTLHHAAVGNSIGSATIQPGPSNNSGMTTAQANELGDIQLTTLDETVHGPIDLIKVDVEGMAASVLEGGLDTIQAHKPDLYIECGDAREYQSVVKILCPIGYNPVHRFNHTPTLLFESCTDCSTPPMFEQAIQLFS